MRRAATAGRRRRSSSASATAGRASRRASPSPPGASSRSRTLLDGAAVAVRGADGVTRRGAVLRRDDALDLALLAVPGLQPAPAAGRAGTRVLVHREGAIVAQPARVRAPDRRARPRPGRGRRRARAPRWSSRRRSPPATPARPCYVGGRLAGIVFARSRGARASPTRSTPPRWTDFSADGASRSRRLDHRCDVKGPAITRARRRSRWAGGLGGARAADRLSGSRPTCGRPIECGTDGSTDPRDVVSPSGFVGLRDSTG